MNIRETFLNLTKETNPYGTEEDLLKYLPKGLTKDEHGNFYLKIGESKTVFAGHLDNACKAQTDVTHVFDGNLIKTDGKSILGADDKAGLTVMLNLINHNVPGLYYFFIGEEVGCVGSGKASRDTAFFKNYDRMICFDRKNLQSIITHQSFERTCSDSFANSLITEFKKNGMTYVKDDGGVYTDSAEFKDVIPECTNISVGYYDEHTVNERQNIQHLEKLATAATKIKWESLSTARDPHVHELKTSSWSSTASSSRFDNTYGYEHDPDYDNRHRRTRRRGGKKNSYEYVNGRNNSTDFTTSFKPLKQDRSKTNFYDIIKDEYLNPKLTEDEARIIVDLCLDPSKEEDREAIAYLVEQVRNDIPTESDPF